MHSYFDLKKRVWRTFSSSTFSKESSSFILSFIRDFQHSTWASFYRCKDKVILYSLFNFCTGYEGTMPHIPSLYYVGCGKCVSFMLLLFSGALRN